METTIYTIGYGARTIDDFLRVLAKHHIAYLVDVRSSPYSRFKPEFSKEALEARLVEAGVRYLFMGDLLGGQPDDPSCHVDGKVVYELIAARPAFQEGLGRLERASQQGLRVALMCSEGKPELCHRTKLIGQQLQQKGIEVIHIDENDGLVPHREVVLGLTGGQLGLFGDPDFTSRKRHR